MTFLSRLLEVIIIAVQHGDTLRFVHRCLKHILKNMAVTVFHSITKGGTF
jgi:hypothetical protein